MRTSPATACARTRRSWRGDDGAIHVAYSYRGRQCIKYVRVTEAWIRSEVDWVYREHVSHAHPF